MDDDLPPDDLLEAAGEDGAPDVGVPGDGAPGNVVEIAPIIAQKVKARSLYWRGWSVSQIASELGIPYATVSSWKTRQKWDEASPSERAEEGILERYLTLIAKEVKSGSDYKEIDLLGRQLERMARIQKYLGGGNETDLNPKTKNRNAPEVKAKKDAANNLLTREDLAKLRADMAANLFGHQEAWLTRLIHEPAALGRAGFDVSVAA